MHLQGSDPDIQTLISRIRSEKLELQPDFQRGEVWTTEKKQALIDTILRGWHIPPIHIVVVEETKRQQVLDGQQRLTAIRDFVYDRYPFNGNCEPLSRGMQELDGLYYSQLPETYRNEFDDYPIRQFLITDYEIGEPGELFHRLNQQARLTPSEKRNAFFGPVRAQVKELVAFMDILGLDKSTIGFSNARMAYDDVLSKSLIFMERRSIREKVTEANVTERYRNPEPFSDLLISEMKGVLSSLNEQSLFFNSRVKFNKATLMSWILFIYRNLDRIYDSGEIGRYIMDFEYARILNKKQLMDSNENISATDAALKIEEEYRPLVTIFNDRSTSRVADASSVVLRDAIINLIFNDYQKVDGFRGNGKFSIDEKDTLFLVANEMKRPSESDFLSLVNLTSNLWGDWREVE